MDAAARSVLEEDIAKACRAQAWAEAATLAIRGYGPEILAYLMVTSGREQDASDAFSMFCESLWRSLPGFRGESSLRTWAYRVAHRSWAHLARSDRRRKARIVAIDAIDLEAVADAVRTQTLPFLRTEMQAAVAQARQQLGPDERALLVLRLDRRLGWDAIARVLSEDDPTPEALKRTAATLRKRYERVKLRLRDLSRGLVPPE